MGKRLFYCLLWSGTLLLLGCNGGDTPLPTRVIPAATVEVLPTQDLTAIDAVLQEIDDEVCREAHETRAEIEALLQQGQDVADLAEAIDELIAELEGCSTMLTPTPP
ncbi:MAG: hypothetical protein L0332_17640 [Chloroflexi bacterium]|nr:hypothetical protein [Chloroflexota bacterium]MCI0579290.1 hypothetical protein [Chloroflexota bacterium]MCI0644350.1 hypothetical protein [Chloroflexota bacterium]MCI0728524.1 hypothetical protein [Chloroflexota bacterium]